MVIREILYPTDFSESARYAGHYATMIARKLDAILHILHVPYVPFPPSPEERTGLSCEEIWRKRWPGFTNSSKRGSIAASMRGRPWRQGSFRTRH